MIDANFEPKSQSNYISNLKTMFNYFSEDIPHMPKFPKVSYQKKVKDVLTIEQQAKVYEFLPKEHLPIFIFLKYSASRPNEGAGLLWEDVHHDTKEIYVQHVITPDGKVKFGTKTKLIRKLMLIPEFEEILQRKDDSPLCFHRNGKPYNTKALEDIWNVAMEKAEKKYKIPRISLYPATKHTFIVDRLNAGWSYEEICAVTGHTNIPSAKGYGRYNLEKVGEIMRGKKEKPFIPSRPAAPLRKRMNLEKETEETDESGKTLATQSEKLTIQNHSESMVGRTGIEPVTY